ncbi:VOC family protein [Dehalobacter sp. DCM]|uniref:VOC family protein n=1 Tax=Dehalobacter sp. DCM TaxID=2907827 RepID=UPI0030816D79|nr:VOC family protein [Dehalobacter sp. DCM]
MITPYINFSGRSGEAIAFYEKALNGQDKRIMYYKDAPPNPDFPVPEAMQDYVLHAEMTICGTKVSFSDTQQGVVAGDMISLALSYPTVNEVTEAFNRLKDGGEVLMELSPQFYSRMYGWVKDKFGIGWQIICLE